MQRARSFRTENFQTFDQSDIDIFTNDFVHENPFIFRGTVAGKKSNVEFEQVLSKDQKLNLTGKTSLWFNFAQNKTLYAKFKANRFKLHFDNGCVERSEGVWGNSYFSLEGDRSWKNHIYKVGFQVWKNQFNINTRLVRYNQDHDKSLVVFSKIGVNQQKWNFNIVNAFNAKYKNWILSNFRVQWNKDEKNLFFLQANAGKKHDEVDVKNFSKNICLSYVRKHNERNTFGIQGGPTVCKPCCTQEKPKCCTQVVWEHKVIENGSSFKAKADCCRNIAISVKNKLGSYGTYTFGAGIHDFGKTNKFSYGVEFDLNL